MEAHRHFAGPLRHSRQDHRQADLHRRRASAWTRARVHRAVPGVRRQGQELRRLQGQVHARRQESRARRRLGRCRRGQLVARQPGPQAGVDPVGCGRERQCVERVDHAVPAHRHRGERGSGGAQGRRFRQSHRRCREGRRGRVLRTLREPRDHGAADGYRPVQRRQGGSLGGHAKRRDFDRRSLRSFRRSAGKRLCAQDARRRRLRAARPAPGIHEASGEDCAEHAGHAGEPAVVARRGHPAGTLSSGGAGEAARRAGRAGQLGRVARAAGRPVDPDHGAADRHQERYRSGQRPLLPGQPVCRAELHQRVRHAQHACAAGILARGGAYEQPVLPRVLHR